MAQHIIIATPQIPGTNSPQLPEVTPENDPTKAPTGWQYDEYGKKYRMVGHCKEYAPTITIDGVEIYQDELEDFHRRNREAKERMLAEQNKRIVEQQTGKQCPVNALQMAHECKTDCALYRADGCAWKRRKAEKDTLGMKCPYMRKCIKECALYDNGCTL